MLPAEFRGEIYYTGYVIIIGEDFSYHIQSYNPQFKKFIVSTT